MKPCEECGETIPASRIRPSGRPTKFCSERCRVRLRNRTIGKAILRRWRIENPEKYAAQKARSVRRQKEMYHLETYGRVLETPEEIMKNGHDRYRHARALGYRSGLEVQVARQLEEAGVKFEYEAHVLRYTVPEKLAKYTPDFILPNGIVIETKGRFVTADRTKHRLIKEQHPALDIRLVFSNPNATIGKKSKTTYAAWCDRLGIPYAKVNIPEAWLKEKPRKDRIDAAKRVLNWQPG